MVYFAIVTKVFIGGLYMPKKLRKTLGDVNSPSVVALMELIDTQNPAKLKWNC